MRDICDKILRECDYDTKHSIMALLYLRSFCFQCVRFAYIPNLSRVAELSESRYISIFGDTYNENIFQFIRLLGYTGSDQNDDDDRDTTKLQTSDCNSVIKSAPKRIIFDGKNHIEAAYNGMQVVNYTVRKIYKIETTKEFEMTFENNCFPYCISLLRFLQNSLLTVIDSETSRAQHCLQINFRKTDFNNGLASEYLIKFLYKYFILVGYKPARSKPSNREKFLILEIDNDDLPKVVDGDPNEDNPIWEYDDESNLLWIAAIRAVAKCLLQHTQPRLEEPLSKSKKQSNTENKSNKSNKNNNDNIKHNQNCNAKQAMRHLDELKENKMDNHDESVSGNVSSSWVIPFETEEKVSRATKPDGAIESHEQKQQFELQPQSNQQSFDNCKQEKVQSEQRRIKIEVKFRKDMKSDKNADEEENKDENKSEEKENDDDENKQNEVLLTLNYLDQLYQLSEHTVLRQELQTNKDMVCCKFTYILYSCVFVVNVALFGDCSEKSVFVQLFSILFVLCQTFTDVCKIWDQFRMSSYYNI